MIQSSRRRVLDTLNGRYLYGRVVRVFPSIRYHFASIHPSLDDDIIIHTFDAWDYWLTLRYNQQPLLHAIIFTIQMIIMFRLIAKFSTSYTPLTCRALEQ